MIKTLEALALVDWYYVLGIGAVLSAATLFAYRKALRPLFLYAAQDVRSKRMRSARSRPSARRCSRTAAPRCATP